MLLSLDVFNLLVIFLSIIIQSFRDDVEVAFLPC